MNDPFPVVGMMKATMRDGQILDVRLPVQGVSRVFGFGMAAT